MDYFRILTKEQVEAKLALGHDPQTGIEGVEGEVVSVYDQTWTMYDMAFPHDRHFLDLKQSEAEILIKYFNKYFSSNRAERLGLWSHKYNAQVDVYIWGFMCRDILRLVRFAVHQNTIAQVWYVAEGPIPDYDMKKDLALDLLKTFIQNYDL